MLTCPQCGKRLITKSIHTVGAGKIEVDYCPSCGGIFFDQGEVNRISTQDARKLSTPLEHTSSADHPKKTSHECPRCGASLRRFFGESVPEDVHVLRCPECSGTWFEAEDLTKFKQAQEAKLHYYQTWKLPLPSLSAVLIPVALLVLLTGVTLITVEQIQHGTFTDSRARETLSKPIVVVNDQHTSATILFTTTVPARTTLTFWHDEPYGRIVQPISESLTTAHQAVVLDLTPGKTYRYQVNVVAAEYSFASEVYTFQN